VFMDHMMPKMDGVEATRILREMGYKNSIIALTANALVGRAEMFMKNGFDGFISKPIDSRELNLFLNDFIRNKQPLEVIEAARKEQNEKISINESEDAHDTRSSEMAEIFVIDAKNAVNILEKLNKDIRSIEGEALNSYIVTVHGMKSALANLGEMEVSGAAFKLEIAGKDHKIDELEKSTPAFIASLHSLIEKYKPEEKEENTDITSIDINFLRDKLNAIKTACAAFDKNTSKTALQELKQKNWPAHINSILDEISIDLLHSSFKKAAAAAEGYLQGNG